jgi:hypothetical protein
MSIRLGITFNILLSMGLAAFLVFGSFGMSHFAMNMDNKNTSCPYMPGMASVCNMNPLEHMAAWQSIFTATADESALTLILFLIFAMIIFVYEIKKRLYPQSRAPLRHRQLAFVYSRSPLQEAFSNGILNPKVF